MDRCRIACHPPQQRMPEAVEECRLGLHCKGNKLSSKEKVCPEDILTPGTALSIFCAKSHQRCCTESKPVCIVLDQPPAPE
jgi:hypothetical protein